MIVSLNAVGLPSESADDGPQPAAANHQYYNPPIIGEKAPASEVNPRGYPRAVLVVDDEPTVRLLITEVLVDLNYKSLEAVDGPSGLQILQSDTPIDLLITDVGLPGGMDGRELATAARVTRPGLAILFITGYAETAALGGGALEPGMMVLTKPFSIDALTSNIRALTS